MGSWAGRVAAVMVFGAMGAALVAPGVAMAADPSGVDCADPTTAPVSCAVPTTQDQVTVPSGSTGSAASPAAPAPALAPAAVAPAAVPSAGSASAGSAGSPSALTSASGSSAPSAYQPYFATPGRNIYNCSDLSPAEAQAILAADPSDPNRLDADHDGIPCENGAGSASVAAYAGYPAGGVATGDSLPVVAPSASLATMLVLSAGAVAADARRRRAARVEG